MFSRSNRRDRFVIGPFDLLKSREQLKLFFRFQNQDETLDGAELSQAWADPGKLSANIWEYEAYTLFSRRLA